MNISNGRKMSTFLNLKPIELTCGPRPMKDTQVFQVAIGMLQSSQEEGGNFYGYVKYDAIRRLQSSYGTFFYTSPEAVFDPIICNNKRGGTFKYSK